MTEREYLSAVEKLQNRAKSMNLTLKFNPDNFEGDHLNCLWWGGHVATIVVDDDHQFTIDVIGDVYVDIGDESFADKNNGGCVGYELRNYFKNDDELAEGIDKDKIIFQNNNWIEVDGYYKGDFVDFGFYTDNVLDGNILVAINQVLDELPTWLECLEELGKEEEE